MSSPINAANHDEAVARDLGMLGLPARTWPAVVIAEDFAPITRELEAFAEPELESTPYFVPARFGR